LNRSQVLCVGFEVSEGLTMHRLPPVRRTVRDFVQRDGGRFTAALPHVDCDFDASLGIDWGTLNGARKWMAFGPWNRTDSFDCHPVSPLFLWPVARPLLSGVQRPADDSATFLS